MIFPLGLLAIAEDLAGRIPNDDAYAAERNASWLAIGKAYLQLNNFEEAFEAFKLLTDPQAQAEFRVAAGQWTGEHPESDAARDLLRDTVNHVESWEPWISRRDVSDLVQPICRALGAEAVQLMVWKVKDAFTAGNVLVELAGLLKDPGVCRETLRSAEELAKGVRAGDRDYALRRVIYGYKRAGLEQDERRVRALMSQDLDLMNETEARMFSDTETLLKPLVPPDPDSPTLRLRRIIDYGYNDLRVQFLAECCEAAGLNDPEAEQLVTSDAYRRIAPARPPSIYSDPSHFDPDELARSLFGRPVRQRESDRDMVDGRGYLDISDLSRFIATIRSLFKRFGEIASRFSPGQIDQGLWYLFGEPFWLESQLLSEQVPTPQIIAITEAMYFPFRDYYGLIADRYTGTAFYMWWDSCNSLGRHPAVAETAFDVLQRILALPHRACWEAALHGLNHLFPDPRAAAIIEKHLDANRITMSKEEIEWAERCKAGMAQ